MRAASESDDVRYNHVRKLCRKLCHQHNMGNLGDTTVDHLAGSLWHVNAERIVCACVYMCVYVYVCVGGGYSCLSVCVSV